MNQTFNFSRFTKLFIQEFLTFKKIYLGIALGVLVFKFIVASLSSNMAFEFEKYLFLSLFSIIGFSIPFIFYKDINNKIRGINYAMLPVSTLEKMLSCLLNCIVLLPAFCMLGYVLGSIICNAFYPYNSEISSFTLYHYYVYLAVQSVGLLGNIFFKRLKFQKTVGIVILVGLIFSILATIIAIYTLKNALPETNFILPFRDYSGIKEATLWSDIWNLTCYIIFPFGLWIAVFFKMKEQEY